MILVYRPSKIRFYRLLKRVLRKSEPFTTVLDFASAGAKNIGFFKGKNYSGADVNGKLQEQARARFRNVPNMGFYTADILCPGIRERFNLVVSTHTLAHVEDKRRAVCNLIDLVKENGSMIIQIERCHYSSVLSDLLFRSFRRMRILYYRGFLSRLYERCLMRIFRTDHLADLPFPHRGGRIIYRFLLLLSLALSFFDFLGRKECVLLLAGGKRNPDPVSGRPPYPARGRMVK